MSFKLYSKEDVKKKLEQFLNEESLFLTLSYIADSIDNSLNKVTTKVENWEDAKTFVSTLLKSKHPDRILSTHIRLLYNNLNSYTMSKRGDNGYYGLEGFTDLTDRVHRNEWEVLLFYSVAILKCIGLLDEERDYSLLLDSLTNKITNLTLKVSMPELHNAIEIAFEDKTLVRDYNYVRNISLEEEQKEEEQRKREENLDKWLKFFCVEKHESIVWKWLSDNKVHWGQPEGLDTDYFEAIIEDMIDGGLVKEPATCDNGYKLTLKGRRRLEGWIQEKLPANLPDNNMPITNKESEEMKSRIKEANDTITALRKEIENLSAENAKLRKKSACESEISVDEEILDVDFHDKVKLEILCKLFENSDADFNKYGNKAMAARLIERISGLPFQTCKNYLTNRNLNTKQHLEEVTKINIVLKGLSLNFTL